MIAAQTNFTATDFSTHIDSVSHDAITRFLSKTKLTPRVLWEYANPFINRLKGYLICDDTVLDHWYGEKIGLAKWQYSETHHDVVHGIGVTTLLWTGAKDEHIPFDYRIYARSDDGKTKNDHFRDMLKKAHERGFTPEAILMDCWYSVDLFRNKISAMLFRYEYPRCPAYRSHV